MSFFRSRIPSRIPQYFYLSACLLRFLLAEIVPQTFLVFDGVLVRCFVDYPSGGVCLMFFSWFNWSYGFWEEDHGGKFSSHHIKGTRYHHDLSLLMVTLITETMFVRFLHSKASLPSPFPYCPLWKEIIMWIRREYLHKLLGIFLPRRCEWLTF